MRNFNIVVLGAGGVGKSALTTRYVKHDFLDYYNPTIEENYETQVSVDGQPYKLEILDTAGAEQFNALNEVYIKSGHGFILAFSLTHEASLREVDTIRQQIYHIKGETTNIPIVVVGTKMDLANEREVTRTAIQDLATRWSLPFYETSAKKDWHVTAVFEDLLQQMVKQHPDVSSRKKKKKNKRDVCLIM
ncbi:small GTPase superfamily [Abortiporus biennis]|nr:small GTPase superfamily [Abortiporus biennis]